jgi:predicted membrane GTPase involved in stress response
MPQTPLRLGRALEMGHKVIVVVNKSTGRPEIYEVIDEVLELLMDLDALTSSSIRPCFFARPPGHLLDKPRSDGERHAAAHLTPY